jgi:hypothetical protein
VIDIQDRLPVVVGDGPALVSTARALVRRFDGDDPGLSGVSALSRSVYFGALLGLADAALVWYCANAATCTDLGHEPPGWLVRANDGADGELSVPELVDSFLADHRAAAAARRSAPDCGGSLREVADGTILATALVEAFRTGNRPILGRLLSVGAGDKAAAEPLIALIGLLVTETGRYLNQDADVVLEEVLDIALEDAGIASSRDRD